MAVRLPEININEAFASCQRLNKLFGGGFKVKVTRNQNIITAHVESSGHRN